MSVQATQSGAAVTTHAEAGLLDGHRLTLHQPITTPLMTYADDRELRREIWEAQQQVGKQDGRDNRPLVRETLELRREKAG